MERVAKDLSLLIETADAPIFGIDAQGRINSWNQQVEISTGYTKYDVIGQHFVNNFIVEEPRTSVSHVLENALKGLGATNFEFPLFSKAEERVDIPLNSMTLCDTEGHTVGGLGVGQISLSWKGSVRSKQCSAKKSTHWIYPRLFK
jgi:PAS domain S-box-containing protein